MPDRRVGTTTQTVPTGVRRIDGPLSGTLAGNGAGTVDVDIAVIDTGIDLDHPDLNVAGGVNCSTGTGYDDETATAPTSPARRRPRTTDPGSSASPPAPGYGPCGCSTTAGRGAGRR